MLLEAICVDTHHLNAVLLLKCVCKRNQTDFNRLLAFYIGKLKECDAGCMTCIIYVS